MSRKKRLTDRETFYSPYYWECLCEQPTGINPIAIIACDDCGAEQVFCPKASTRDLLDWNIDPYPYDCASIISQAKAALDIISDVTIRNGRHASYITDELLVKSQFCAWLNGSMVEMVTDGIGLFIAKVMTRVRHLMAGVITDITIHKFTNERSDGNYIFVGVAVNGIWLISDGMTDFSGSGGRAYQDMSAVIGLWAWLYNADIKTEQHTQEDYQKLCLEVCRMHSEEC